MTSYGYDTADISRRRREAQRAADDEWYAGQRSQARDALKDITDDASYEAFLASIEETRRRAIEIYGEYPEKLAPILQELSDMETEAAERRGAAVVKIEKAKVDALIGSYDELLSYWKSMDGLTMSDGSVFHFSVKDEIALTALELSEIEKVIADYESRLDELTEAERADYEARLKQRDQYNRRLGQLNVDLVREEQSAAEQRAKEINSSVWQTQVDNILSARDAQLTALLARFASQKSEQAADFAAKQDERDETFAGQMSGQAQNYALWRDSISAWFASVQNDISELQTFDFDNFTAFSGATKLAPVIDGGGSVTETLTITASGLNLASRVTSPAADGGVDRIVTVYGDDGSTVKKQFFIKYNTDGTVVMR